MSNHVVKRGLDLPIAGAASGSPIEVPPPATVAYAPVEFRGMIPKPAVKEGATVQQGDVLFFHKRNPDIVVRSPIAGTVKEIRRGHRRVITDFVVERSEGGVASFKSWTLAELASAGADDARKAVLDSGFWPSLRTRPLNNLADPSETPQAILIGGMETGPLQPGPEQMIEPGHKDALQAAVHALGKLTDGLVHLATSTGSSHPAFQGLQGVSVHTFSGPHPAGDPTVQINLVDPPRGGRQVWYLRAHEAVAIGRFLLEGKFPAERVYAAVGTGVKSPRFVKTVIGAPLASIVGEAEEGQRWISGSVLSGTTVDPAGWASFYASAVHLIPNSAEREFFGWITPQFGKFSFHRAFLAGFGVGTKTFKMNPGLQGGHRAIIPFGRYEDVVATPDVQPQFLFRSISAGDMEDAIKLGMLDISEEEAALMTYICPSKIEYDVLLREGLESFEKES